MTASSPEADSRAALAASMEAQAHVHAMAATMAQAAMSPPMPPGAQRPVPSPNTSRPGSMGQQRPAVAAAPPKPAAPAG